jgi:hypothetical protein
MPVLNPTPQSIIGRRLTLLSRSMRFPSIQILNISFKRCYHFLYYSYAGWYNHNDIYGANDCKINGFASRLIDAKRQSWLNEPLNRWETSCSSHNAISGPPWRSLCSLTLSVNCFIINWPKNNYLTVCTITTSNKLLYLTTSHLIYCAKSTALFKE